MRRIQNLFLDIIPWSFEISGSKKKNFFLCLYFFKKNKILFLCRFTTIFLIKKKTTIMSNGKSGVSLEQKFGKKKFFFPLVLLKSLFTYFLI